jgi:fused signal recognition particle receptor
MVFDWFKRAVAQPAPEPEPLPAPEVEPEPEAAAAPEESVQPVEPVAAPTPAPVAPAGAGVDEDALAWARQAYARLKAQQEAASPPVVAPEPEPQPAATEPVPTAPEPPPPAAPPVASGLSLLEQAAAQRQQRLQEITAPAEPAPAVPPAASATPAAVEADAADPSLGAFDDTFTWSAEVLAAQGRSAEDVSLEEIDWLGRLRRGLEKTRKGFVTQLLENLGDDPLTPAVLDDLESTLLRADVGVKATDQVLEALRRRLNEEVVDPAEGLRFLKEQLRGLLDAPIHAGDTTVLAPQRDRLNVWLLVGVNGVGKTTTLGKLANLAVRSGYSCLIAAADTFRAAAVQQVSVWGERSGVAVVANPSANADPAAVVYDAIGAARSKGTELVLVDTAGRLQTKHNLMEELGKVRRTITKLAPEAVVESLLVLDASQGQNGLRQAMAFASAAGLTGVVLTKLDGSARGGVALAVASEAGLPIRFIGAGEGIRDLRPFNSFEFVEALLAS